MKTYIVIMASQSGKSWNEEDFPIIPHGCSTLTAEGVVEHAVYNAVSLATEPCCRGTTHALPGRPTWMISLPLSSSLLNTGHPRPSSFVNVNSSFVPIILYVELVASICPNNKNSVLYRLLSAVGRSSLTVVEDGNSTVARALSIFFK